MEERNDTVSILSFPFSLDVNLETAMCVVLINCVTGE